MGAHVDGRACAAYLVPWKSDARASVRPGTLLRPTGLNEPLGFRSRHPSRSKHALAPIRGTGPDDHPSSDQIFQSPSAIGRSWNLIGCKEVPPSLALVICIEVVTFIRPRRRWFKLVST